LAFNFNVQPKGSPFDEPPTKAQIAFLDILKVFESFYFGLAFTFMIFAGILCSQVHPKFRLKILSIYLSIVWLMVSWFPHITLHTFYPTTWGLIALDLCFHMTAASAAFVLTYFVVRLMQASTKTKFRRIKSLTWRNIIRADTFHIFVITLGVAIVLFCVAFAIPPMGPPPTLAQIVLLRILLFAESCIFGVSVAFVVKMIPVVRRMEDDRIRRKSMFLVVCIAWVFANWWPHVRLHGIVDKTGRFTPANFITIDAVFHWSVMLASGVLCYVVFGLIKLAIDVSNSPFRRDDSKTRSTVTMTDITMTGADFTTENSETGQTA